MPKNSNSKIEKTKWYTAREASELLRITEDTIKKRCREGSITGKQVGARKQWHIQESEINRVRKEWNLEDIDS
jgi:excisionase family DNA binding protein